MQNEKAQDPTETTEEPSEEANIAAYMAETDAKLDEIASKMERFASLTIQAVSEIEQQIGKASDARFGQLRAELRIVRKQLSDIMEE